MYDFLGYYDICYLGGEVRDPGPRDSALDPHHSSRSRPDLLRYQPLHHRRRSVARVCRRRTPESEFIVSTFMERLYGRGCDRVHVPDPLDRVGSVFALLLGYSRIPYAAARDGCFFSVFGRLHPTKRFPHVSLIVLGGISILCSLLPLGVVIDALITTRILVQFIGQVFAVMVLRASRPDMPRPFRMWLYPVPAMVALAGWTSTPDVGLASRRARPRHAGPRHRVLPGVVIAHAPMALWRQGPGSSERVTRYRRILAGVRRLRLLLRPVAVPGRNRMSDRRARSGWIVPALMRLASAGLIISAFATAHLSSSPSQRRSTMKALVGGTLVDGFGGKPIRNSVVLIEGERIAAVGRSACSRCRRARR